MKAPINLRFKIPRNPNQYKDQHLDQHISKQQTSKGGFESFPIIVYDETFNTHSSKQPVALYTNNNTPLIESYAYYYNQRPNEPHHIVSTSKMVTKNINKPNVSPNKPPMKLIDLKPRVKKLKQLPKMDVKLLKAVQQPNSRFVVEEFFLVPGRRIADISSVKSTTPLKSPSKKLQKTVKLHKIEVQEPNIENEETSTVKVESIGMTASDQPIPDYSAFFPQSLDRQTGNSDEATLILEPHSRALSGNDGTSISSPFSRAILRKDTSVKLLYRPQSVAITGANGIAHAQADLLIEFIEDE